MDVTSYLLGKNVSGGGGGSTTKLVPLTLTFTNYTGDIIDTKLIDSSRLTTMLNMFQNCSNVEELDLSGWNFENVTNMNNMFNGCSKLKTIKAEEIYAPNSTGFTNSFSNCSALEDIPVINAPKTTKLNGTFNQIGEHLTDKSLDNILLTCIKATSYSSTKTLSTIGIKTDTYPASRIQSLPHYQDFVNAGWSIGS